MSVQWVHPSEARMRALEHADHAQLFQSELVPARTRRPVALPRPLPVVTIEPPALVALACHAGLFAVRLAASSADIEAHPALFRCPTCAHLLDAPAWNGPVKYTNSKGATP